ncbi:hypothetical protein Tco_1003051 [Tanacetum coccineum]|uniref:Uncharacterized protein n=1 Tax=Tanacetum coccineum TaxID=301880 RepID=A0ABQ5F803_9ASTR
MLHPNRLSLPSFGKHWKEKHVTWARFGKKRDEDTRVGFTMRGDGVRISSEAVKVSRRRRHNLLCRCQADQASVFMVMTSVHISSGLVLHQMTYDHNRSELGIQDHSNEPSSSKLVLKVVPLAHLGSIGRKSMRLGLDLGRNRVKTQELDLQCVETASGFPLMPSKFQGDDVTTFCDDVKRFRNIVFIVGKDSGANERPPMLKRGNYIPWESRFRRFLDNKLEEGERMWNSIQNGPYVRPIIPDPDDAVNIIVQFKPHVLASKAKKAAKNHDPLAFIAHSNASSSQSHANSSYSLQPYYVTHPSSVVDYEDEYQGELQGDS